MVKGRALEHSSLLLPGGIKIEVTDEVISHFQANVQRRWRDREAGGQLFAHISSERWLIARATGPRSTDRRSRFTFRPDRSAERQEILSLFDENLHYVGDWHTHAEDIPSASFMDIRSMRETVRKSIHSLPGFIMAIVGRAPPPEGLWWSFHDRDGCHVRL